MRYAVISDIHSNIEALKAFLREADRLKAGRIVCLGDIVGYNANPNECVDLMREREALSVMGNHDSRAAGLEETAGFNEHAVRAIEWTRGVLTEENREFLKGLPRSLVVDRRFLAVHGWVKDTDQYILGASDALRNFEAMKGENVSLCFFGHTHVAISYLQVDGQVVMSADDEVRIRKGAAYLMNPGGLGQPRDRDPRASFIIYDTRAATVTYHRVEYDIQATVEKIMAAGLPERLAERLKLGW
jgi:predicted phosphodiesterase